jgi:glutaminyl-tRNA synthetase
LIDLAFLEQAIREDLNRRAPRIMAVLRPLNGLSRTTLKARSRSWRRSIIRRMPAWARGGCGSRQDDFRETPPPKYYRLSPGTEVRLRYAYFVTCVGAVKDERMGEVVEVRCTCDPATRGGEAPDGRKLAARRRRCRGGGGLRAPCVLAPAERISDSLG